MVPGIVSGIAAAIPLSPQEQKPHQGLAIAFFTPPFLTRWSDFRRTLKSFALYLHCPARQKNAREKSRQNWYAVAIFLDTTREPDIMTDVCEWSVYTPFPN